MTNLESIVDKMNFKYTSSDILNGYIGKVLLKMPEEIQDFCDTNVIFIETDPKESGFCFNLDDLYGEDRSKKFLIILHTNFHNQSEAEKKYVIAHEIGHAFLRHENGSTDPKQEKEADEFAAKYGFIKK